MCMCVCICWCCELLCGETMLKLSEYPDEVFPIMLRTGHPEYVVWLHWFWRHGKLHCEICWGLTSIPELIFYHWSISWLAKRWREKAKPILLSWCRHSSVSVMLVSLWIFSSLQRLSYLFRRCTWGNQLWYDAKGSSTAIPDEVQTWAEILLAQVIWG